MFTVNELIENLNKYHKKLENLDDISINFDMEKQTLKIANICIWFDKNSKNLIFKSTFNYARSVIENISVSRNSTSVSLVFNGKQVDCKFLVSSINYNEIVYNLIVDWILLIDKKEKIRL
jgi:hypothetical protein